MKVLAVCLTDRHFERDFFNQKKRRIDLIGCVLFFVLVLGLTPVVRAVDGELDPTFGVGGKVLTTIPGNDDLGRAVAVQADGKIIIVGDSGIYPVFHSALLRYNSNGTLDTSFGNGGVVIATIDPDGDTFTSLAIQPDGKIVAAGAVLHDNFVVAFTLARFNTNGSLDQTFGSGGKVITTFGDPDAEANAVVLQPDGKIIAAGWSGAGSYSELNDFAVARFNENGSLDHTFGSGGKVKTHFEGVDNTGSRATSAMLQPDGKLIVAGHYKTEVMFREFAVARYNTDGNLDATFGTGGLVHTPLGNANVYAMTAALQSDGRVVLAGFLDRRHNNDFAIARFTTNGALDSNFNNDGIAIDDLFGSSDDVAYSLTIQPDGRIIAAGRTGQYPNFRFGLARYTTNGSLDQSFGTVGKMLTDFGSSSSQSYGSALQPDGKLVVVGYSLSGSTGADFTNDFALARYIVASARRTMFDFDGDSKTDISVFRPFDGTWWWQRSTDQAVGAAQFGGATDKIVPADFTGDGKTDIAFIRTSTNFWHVLRSEDGTYFGFPFGTTGDIPVPADYDGDGKADAAIYRPSSNLWVILKSSNGQADFVTFGSSGDQPVPSDYDGDGKVDIAVFRPSGFTPGAAEWWSLRSSNQSVLALQFGSSNDKAVPGDFTGDGKADVAFWRPSNGNWYVLRSEDFSFFSFPFGTTGDIPLQGDYDGDGKADAGVFRPSNSTWFVNRSAGGQSIVAFGLGTDTPVPNTYVR